MIHYKNHRHHRSWAREEKRLINFSNPPHLLFEKPIINDQSQPISCWAIPSMINKNKGIFGLFDGRLISYCFKDHTITTHLTFRDRIYSSPLFLHEQNLMIAASDSGELAAVDLKTFTVVWHIQLPQSIHSSPSFYPQENLLYVGCYDNTLNAIDVQTGTLRYKRELELGVEEDPYSSPIIANEQIYIGTGHKLVALSPDLTLNWSLTFDAFIDSSPALHLGLNKGIVASESGKIILFHLDGKVIREWDTSFHITSSPAISTHGIACIGNDQGTAYGISFKTDEILWQKTFQAPFKYTAITCTPDQHFVFTLHNGEIVCVDGMTGETHWSLKGSQGYHTPPLITDDGYLLCGSHFGIIAGYQFSHDT